MLGVPDEPMQLPTFNIIMRKHLLPMKCMPVSNPKFSALKCHPYIVSCM